MEESLKFYSQICTTKEQSQHLLGLGLKPETADMSYYKEEPCLAPYEEMECPYDNMVLPAWSLHRLLDILPYEIIHEDCYLILGVSRNIVYYADDEYAETFKSFEGDLYECITRCIEWLIKEDYFNKEYLKQ